jgi:hypothetical protein
MKNILKYGLCALTIGITAVISAVPVFADLGDFSFFGGISEGRPLPKTTELLVKNKKNEKLESVYKEMIFLSGKPQVFEGIIEVDNGYKETTDKTGKYDVKYSFESSAATNTDVADIDREINYEVTFRTEGTQTIRDFTLDDWKETITLGDVAYTIDEDRSKSSISVIEDKMPGVTYYKGNLSHRAVYTSAEGDVTTLDMNGSFYGYNCAYSSTETHRIDCTVTTDDWQMQYQLRPSVSRGKTLEYTQNEPTAISFAGNYREILANTSGLSYNIYVVPSSMSFTDDLSGSISIENFNDFEQLLAPDVSFLKGHFAEDDIRRMFSMEILTGDPKFYQPNQAITRGEFTQMLVRAIKLPIEETKKTTSKRKTVVNAVFPDVLSDRADYPYIMAAYNAGLAIGRDNGLYYTDSPIERQEAITILMRTLGLESLGLDPTPVTPFTDDANVADWAKQELYAANRLGIISADSDGKIRPKDYITKAEAAALVNRLNNYMRTDLKTDYTEHIVNYAN